MVIEPMEARRLLTTELGVVRPSAGEALTWELSSQLLSSPIVNHSFAYGLKAGAPGAGAGGNDFARAGDLSGVGFDQVIAIRSSGPTLQWHGDTDRDLGTEYLFRFGSFDTTPLVADMNGDGIDDVIAVDTITSSTLNEWFVHYGSASGYPTDDSLLLAHATFSFGSNGDKLQVGDINGDGRADVIAVQDDGTFLDWKIHFAKLETPYPTSTSTELIVEHTIQNYGSSNDTPVVGNWDNLGGENIGVVDSDTSTATWNLDTDGGGAADISKQFGLPNSQFIVGKWADVLWDGSVNSNWSEPANWSNSAVPTSASSVVIDQPVSAAAIDITINSNVKSLVSTEPMAFNANLTSTEDVGIRATVSLSNAATLTARSVSLRNATLNNHDLTINASDSVILSGALAASTGGVTIASARGIRLAAGGSIATTTGAISLQANQQVVASTGNFDGIFIGGPIATSTGRVTIAGKSGTATENHGVRIVAGGSLNSTSVGALPINVTGRSVGVGAADGIRFDSGGSISSGYGDIQLTGISDNDNGVDTFFGSIASTGSSEGAATIAINGTSHGSSVGTFIGFSHLITSQIGDISIVGQSAAGTGLEFNFTGRVRSLGTSDDAADIFISGTSLATSGFGYGAQLSNSFGDATTLAGDISIVGTSTAPGGSGVNLGSAFTVSAGGEGKISVSGAGVSTGVLLGQIAPPLIQSNNGVITFSTANSLVGLSGTTVNSGAGVTIDVGQSSSYAGNLTAAGNFTKLGEGQITFNGLYNVGSSSFQRGASMFPATANVQSVGSSVFVTNAIVNFSSGEVISSGNVTLTSGTWTGTDNVVVGGRLAGTGTIGSSVTVSNGATAAPGNSPGILNTANLTLAEGSLLEIELGGLTPGNTSNDHDQINVTGTVSLAGNLSVLKFNGFVPRSLNTFTIINNDGVDPVVGTFSGLAEGSSFTSDGLTYSISYAGGTGNDVVITALSTVFLVTNTNDDGLGSFRRAILQANDHPGSDTIQFNIAGSGPHKIQLSTALPTITHSVGIDGYSQPGYAGKPVIVLEGTRPDVAIVGPGLTLSADSDGSTIRGLAINGFLGVGLLVYSDSNTFHGNFIGTSADGMSASGNATWGLMVIGGANNTIGGTSPGNQNIVSGNLQGGIAVIATGANDNQIQGNLIGVNATGNADLGNVFSGIFIGDASGFSGGYTGFATNTIVGGDSVGARNIISGNNNSGIFISGSGSSGNIVRGNYIGTDLNGSAAIGNSFWGIIVSNAPENTIGGINPGQGNLVSGNAQGGVAIFSAGAVDNVVQGNRIGVNADGDADLGNGYSGIYVGLDFAGVNGSASNNTIGGFAGGARNIISGNDNYGVWIRGSGANNNIVQGNYIGTDKDGTLKIANSWSGVAITDGASNNLIGTFEDENGGFPGEGNEGNSDTDEGNLISGNSNHGVWVNGTGTTDNVIAGNRIGTTANGLTALGNYNSGVFIADGASYNKVGGTRAVSGNIIGGNATSAGLPGEGVHVDGPLADGNQILGNSIGIGVDGSTSIPNGFAGIRISQATNTIVGGLTETPGAAPGNVVSSNLVHGIFIDSGASGTSIQGNLIGTDASGALDRGNAFDGIQILSGSSNNVVGGLYANSRNVISGNNRNGILIDGVGTNQNIVAGNYIGTNRSGTSDLGNTGHGIAVSGGADDTRIGTAGSIDELSANERNVVSGNDLWGAIVVADEGTDRTIIAGNYVGTNKDGDAAVGNNGHSIVVFQGADDTRIGTDGNGISDSDERNILSGNLWGVVVEGAATLRTVIAGNYIGTNKNGDGAIPNGGSGAIEVRYGARDTRIGTDGSNDEFNEHERNVISGNSTNGIFIQTPLYNGLAPAGGATTDGTIVAGNFIGVNALGTATLPNAGQGILARNRATNVRIGTDGNAVADLEERNVISGNTGAGILIEGWSLMGLSIAEQFVSGAYPTSSFAFTVPQADIVDASASAAGNWGFNHGIPGGGGNYYAVRATGTLQVNTGGTFSFALGSDDGGRLRINGVDVVVDDTAHVFANRFGNATLNAGTHTFEWYGFDRTGFSGFEVSVAVGGGNTSTVNQANGWEVLGSPTPHSQIALVDSIEATVFYSEPGMINTKIAGNYIGTDPVGTLDFGNSGDGIRVQANSQGVTIGGSGSVLQNVISGNNSDGIEFGFGGRNNVVSGNTIGLNAAGRAIIGNTSFGVNITAGNLGTRIGTNSDNVDDAAERNIISGNLKGIQVAGLGTNQTLIAGNYIGIDIDGMRDLGNTQEGVLVLNAGPIGTIVGGTVASARNVISGNDSEGIEFSNVVNGGGIVQGNYVGLDAAGVGILANGLGVLVRGTSGVTIGGSLAGAGNVISSNASAGVIIQDVNSFNTIVQGNLIGTDFSGTLDRGNAIDGISVRLGASNNTIGGSDSGLLQFDVDGFNAPIGETHADRIRMTESNMVGDSGNGNFAPTATLQGVTVSAIRTAGSNTQWRDRGTSGLDAAGQPLNQLLRDFIGVDAPGAEITVTISGLPAGSHTLTSYHHDWNVWSVANNFDIIVNDANGLNQQKANDADFISSLNPYLGSTYNVVSNGRDAVVIRIIEDGETDRVRFNGLTIQSSRAFAGNVISGNAGDGVDISDASAAALVIGNFIGLSAVGNAAVPNDQNGVILQGAITNTAIGGTTDRARNVIGGNLLAGVAISGPAATSNSVVGNYIGTDVTGSTAIANAIGVSIANGAINNVIGGWTNLPGTGAGNVISGNSLNGVNFVQTALSNSVRGNLIGLAADGLSPLANDQSGIQVFSPDAIIGGDDDDDGSANGVVSSRNVVSGNPIGITVTAAGVNLNARIHGNFVGTNRGGTSAVPNTIGGVLIDGATGTRIGGTTAGAGNVISGNNQYGVRLSGASAGVIEGLYNATIQANFIGTNIGGMSAIPNAVGVQLQNSNNLIGGSDAAKNIISGNTTDGILISGAAALSNLVQSNYIGIDANGTKSLSNATGVTINAGAAFNLIGGHTQSRRNIISGNAGNGIAVTAAGTLNKIQGNFIGTDFSGTLPVGNASTAVFEAAGIHISSMAGQTVVVGTDSDSQNDATEGNVVSGNLRNGIRIEGGNSDSGSHVVAGNRIGVDLSATDALPNQGDGIIILSSNANRIGTNGDDISDAFEANVIAGNRNLGANPGGAALKASGLLILDSNLGDGKSAANNLVAGNFFGTDSSKTRALGNQGAGIRIDSAAGTVVGSNNPLGSNYIYFGNDDGVQILGTAESGLTAAQTSNLLINSFTSNAGLAIDLGDDGVSLNDNGDSNGIANFPILTSVTTQNGQLTVRGVMPASKSFELYIASAEANSSFGEGRTFLAAFTEGVDDLAGGTGSYGPLVDNVTVSQGTVTDNSFEFTVPLPAGLNAGMLVTTRSKGTTSEFGLLAIVGEQASRIAPTIFLDASATISVGDAFQLTGRFVDPDSSSWTATVDYGDGTASSFLSIGANNTFTLNHTYELDGVYSVEVSVTDNSLPPVTSTATLLLTVNNTSPQVEINGVKFTKEITENSIASLTGSFNNANRKVSHTVLIDWDDETPPTTLILPPGVREFSATHRFADDSNKKSTPSAEDTYNVQVTISSNAGANSSPLGLYLIQVKNVRPKNLVVQPSALTLSEGDTLQFNGSFFDPGVLDKHRVLVKWGDGTIENLSLLPSGLNGPTTKSLPLLSHTYANNRVDAYEVIIEVTDDDEPSNPVRYTRLFPVTNVGPSQIKAKLSSSTIF
jgi:PKD domain/PA14 domain